MDPHQLAAAWKAQARQLGFALAGIAPAEPSRYRAYFRQWLDDGQAGTMAWLARRFDERTDPAKYLPGARSILCVGMNYNVPLAPVADADRPHHGRIARYALGDDYHEAMEPRLHALADWLRVQVPDAQTRCAVDTAPVMEKELAARAGVGWLGKNTCIINEQVGSWLLLGEVLTTADLPADQPAIDRCGTCRKCLDACPTGAITAPYQLDARRCISYLTIEAGRVRSLPADGPGASPAAELRTLRSLPADGPGASSAAELRTVHGWLYGCDVCQEVCPWNGRAPFSADPSGAPRFATGTLDLRELENWTEETYRARLRRSAMRRVKLPVLQRNGRLC